MDRSLYEEHSVIIWFNYGKEEDEPFYELSDLLDKVISESQVGIYDGHEIAMDNTDGSFYMYGPNAEVLFKTIKPTLEKFDFMKGATAHLRFGPADDALCIDIEI